MVNTTALAVPRLLLAALACSAAHALPSSAASEVTGGPTLNKGLPPGQNFDLSHFKLQLPVGKPAGGVVEVKQPQLSQYTSPYFFTDPVTGGMVFLCPDSGSTTAGSHFTRTELRDMTAWTFRGAHSMNATLAVMQQPSTKSIIIGQIHGSQVGSEALKIRWVDGAIVVAFKTTLGAADAKTKIASDLRLGQTFSYTVSHMDREVTVTVNGRSVTGKFDDSWDVDQVYFKAGNYLQDNTGSGSVGKVVFYALSTQ